MLFLIFVNLSVLLGLAAAVLHFSDLTSDPKWERWCGQALLFALVPVVVTPGVAFFHIPIAPMLITITIWGVIGVLLYQGKKHREHEEAEVIDEHNLWKCTNCGELNPKISHSCFKCNRPKP